MEITCSVDKLTLVAGCTHDRQFVEFMNDARRLFVKDHQFNPTGFPYIHNWRMVDGSYLQLAAKEAPVPALRMETNPNNCMADELVPFLSFFDTARVTRIDTAIDYPDDLSRYIWTDAAGRKSVMYRSGSGKLETLYIGAARSDTMYRIYDKAKEQKIDGMTWYRVECQKRFAPSESVYFPPQLFRPIRAALPAGETVTDRALIHYLKEFPSEVGNLKRSERERYKRLTETAALRSPVQPQKVYEQNLEPLALTVQPYLDACNSVASPTVDGVLPF